MWKPSVLCEADRSPVPIVPELYKIYSIFRTLVYHFNKIFWHLRWIPRPGIVLALLLIMLSFLNIIPDVLPYYGHAVVVPTVSSLEGLYSVSEASLHV